MNGKETATLLAMAGFFGIAVFMTFLWIDAVDANDAASNALSTCQQENADLRGKVKVLTFEQMTALRNLDYLKGCPASAASLQKKLEECRAEKYEMKACQPPGSQCEASLRRCLTSVFSFIESAREIHEEGERKRAELRAKYPEAAARDDARRNTKEASR